MNITVNVNLTASPEFLAVLQQIANGFVVIPTGVATNGNGKAHKSEPAPVREAAKEQSSRTETATATLTDIKIEDIRATVQAKSQGGKRDEVKALLKKFETDSVTNLAKEKYADFLNAVKAL